MPRNKKNLYGQYTPKNEKCWCRYIDIGLKVGTEGLIIAAQGQNLPTRNYQANILKMDQAQIWINWPLSVQLPNPNTSRI